MIKGYYENGFDILGFADHGVIGKNWNERLTQLPLNLYQYIAGGICFSQPFTCDDGNIARFIIEDDRTDAQIFFDKLAHVLSSMRIYVVFQELYRKIF